MFINDRLVFYPFAVICLASEFRSFQALLTVFSTAKHLSELRLARPPRPKSDQGVLGEKMSESKIHIMDGGALGQSEE